MKRIALSALLAAGLLFMSCSGARKTVFLHPDYNFGVVERVAIVPFVNLTTDAGMGEFVARLFIAEMLSTNAFDVVEIGEVVHALNTAGKQRDSELSTEEIQKLAAVLDVQSFIFGSVGESAVMRSGNISSHAVSLEAHMVDVESGVTVWSSTVQIGGPGPLARLVGVGEMTRGEAARKAVHKSVYSLVR